MLITAVIVFLMVNVWDLHRERSEIRLVQEPGVNIASWSISKTPKEGSRTSGFQ